MVSGAYTEGLTLEEAKNDLSVFGAYGKNLHNQFGAPIDYIYLGNMVSNPLNQ